MTTALLFRWLVPALSLAWLASSQAATNAIVTIATNLPAGLSQLQLGVTHTQVFWEKGDPMAVARARNLLAPAVGLQNQSIMGWGAGPVLQTAPGAAFDFSGLDARVELMRSLGSTMALTLCTAPGWMKTSGQDWNMDDRVADSYFADFAHLCQAIAQRYPDVKYFIVWNEMKGYWNSSLRNSDGSYGNWDYVRYTTLYNAVFTAIKSVRPAAQLGGFYLPVAGDGSNTRGYSGTGTETPILARDLDCLNYWLAHKAGADFIAVDRWLAAYNNPNRLTEADQFALTWTYQTVLQLLRARTNLPIWFSEYYTASYNTGGSQFIACAEASIYYSMIQGAGTTPVTALLWNPSQGESGVAHYLFTSTATPAGGQPTPHSAVFQWFQDYFGPGAPLCQANSSDPRIQVLATPSKTLLINQYATNRTVTINGSLQVLPPYGVVLIPTPSQRPRITCHYANYQFTLEFQGSSALSYLLETTSNLVDWSPLLTNAPTSGYFTFTETNAHAPQRFYRVRF